MSDIVISGPIGYLSDSNTSVWFSQSSINASAGASMESDGSGTAAPVKEMQTALKVAYWGEDNRFPQNIEQQMAYCGIGKAALDWKARILWGNGIIPGKVISTEDEGAKDVFQPLDRVRYKEIYSFINNRKMFRFFLEYLQDWVWFNNCFPEIILSYDAKTITGFVHQESCDSRFKQMNPNGVIDTVYLSKLWGAPSDQFAKFDPKKRPIGLTGDKKIITEIDNVYVKALDCIDMYNAVSSLKKIAAKQAKSRKLSALKSAILPVNYPSPNKTYYQLPTWDGARLAGWVEIASKIPAIIKTLYSKAFRIKNHVEIPMTYFEEKYGYETWKGMDETKRIQAKKDLLKEMNDFLSGEENAYKTMITFFNIDTHTQKDYGHVVITPIEDKTSIDKELLTGSAAGIEIITAMGLHVSLVGIGMPGSGGPKSGGGSGSDIREALLMYLSQINLERNVLLEPLYLARDFNREVGGKKIWEEDIEFRFRDTVLTTLDKGKGTQKVLS